MAKILIGRVLSSATDSVTAVQGTTPWVVGQASPSTAARSSVPAAVADTLLLAANPARLGATITNDSSNATLRVGYGAAPVSATDFSVTLLPGGSAYLEVPFGFTGEIRGIWDIASGDARITEMT